MSINEQPPTGISNLAYLVSRYPAFSHTFILNEVLRLKSLGFTFALRRSTTLTARQTPSPQTRPMRPS